MPHSTRTHQIHPLLLEDDLRGANLSGADLRNQDLSGRDLSGAQLFKADLRGANLENANLENAELSAANLEGAILDGAQCKQAGFGGANLSRASLFKANLERATLTQANLAHANLNCINLGHSRLREANLESADLTEADLRYAELSLSSVHKTNFNNADLRHARLRMMRRFKSALWIGVDIRDVNFSGAYLMRREIIDQNFIKEFRSYNQISKILYYPWLWTCDCGRSMFRWCCCIGVLLLIFASFYNAVGIDYGNYPTSLSPFYFSVVTMTTLGFGDVMPSTIWGQIVVILEVTAGYIMLGGLLSIFSNKLARRGE
ncbi:MAG: pentapeptide repeat-containing protein [Deltaproteobacteria bacterium]|nr:pentapeptide repeat-containing protein [Deltaproteobacteria bacterium]